MTTWHAAVLSASRAATLRKPRNNTRNAALVVQQPDSQGQRCRPLPENAEAEG
jgi:hypothetical protein